MPPASTAILHLQFCDGDARSREASKPILNNVAINGKDMTTNLQSLLFLCTGNYYRSRFAEILFNHRAIQHGLKWRAQSRGLRLNPDNAGPISCDTVAWLRRLGADLPKTLRRPMSVVELDLDGADHIVAVKKAEHLPLLQAQFPKYVERVEFWNVHDLDCAGPDEALHNLEREIVRLMGNLCS